MVKISMEAIERLRDEVNDFLKNDNESSFLKMAYEEVLFPVVFTGKKKYYGIPHTRKPNFNNKLFIRGVEIVKRGQSSLFRKVGRRIMDESMKVDNLCTLHQIIEDVLEETVKDIFQTDFNEIIRLLCGGLIKITRAYSASFHECGIGIPMKKQTLNGS